MATKKQQDFGASILSLIAQKYSLDLSNENHIKKAKQIIELFVSHILLYFYFPHYHKSKHFRFLNNYTSIHFLLAGIYAKTNWAEVFQILFLLLPIWRYCNFCIYFKNKQNSPFPICQVVKQQPIEWKYSKFYFCSCQFGDIVIFVFILKISTTHHFLFGRELNNNQLSGSIPDSISALTNLQKL